MDGLWQETCFELFLSTRGSDGYWEFNLSPSGNWNVYRFNSYRKGMREEEAYTGLPFSIEVREDSLVVSLETDISALIREDQQIDAGIAAVVRMTDGTISYWALTQLGPKPDFHRRDGFIMKL